MGIVVFLAIVGLVGWFIYQGTQRQSERFANAGTAVRTDSASTHQPEPMPTGSGDSMPLYVNLTQSFHGDHDKVIQTLRDVADMLQKEVNARDFPDASEANAQAIDHEAYRNLVSEESKRLASMFQKAEIGFEQASSATGTPEILRQAYAAFLDQLISAQRTLCSVQAPASYSRTQVAYRVFLTSFYQQVSSWPTRFRAASVNVVGDSCELTLSAQCDVSVLQRAIQTESA